MNQTKEDLTTLLQTEHSKSQTLKIVNYVGEDQNRFDALFEIFTTAHPRVIQRASWAVNYCVESHPNFLSKHYDAVVKNLDPSVPDAVKRNCTRMLQYTLIPQEWLGHVFDRCFNLAYSSKEPIAVRCFSLQVLHNVSMAIPELKNEVLELLNDLKDHESPGIKSRVRRLSKTLNS